MSAAAEIMVLLAVFHTVQIPQVSPTISAFWKKLSHIQNLANLQCVYQWSILTLLSLVTLL